MKKLGILFAVVVAVVVVVALLNPSEADFREHIRQKEGLAGSFGLAVADLLSGDKNGGIRRDNYVVASRFYFGGDGLLPRRDVAWGFAGRIWETKDGDKQRR